MKINGIAHVQITVNDFEQCRAFYGDLFELFEMTVLFDQPGLYYAIGGRTGYAITQSDPGFRDEHFEQRRIGLHHVCFRLRSREDVDVLHEFLERRGAKIVHAPEDGPWAPGYYSVLFEDPDGIRLEANYVPGKGNLAPNIQVPRPTPDVL